MKHGKMYLTMCLLSMVLVLAAGCGNNNAAGTNTGNTTEQNGTDTPAGNDTVNDNGMNTDTQNGTANDALGVNPDGVTGDTDMNGTVNDSTA